MISNAKRKLSNVREGSRSKKCSSACTTLKIKKIKFTYDSENVASSFLKLENELVAKAEHLNFGSKVSHIYNPLDYAYKFHSDYINKYCQWKKDVLLLGMNPGPWGMCQTGVPFGEVSHVKNWLKIEGEIKQPKRVHTKRPIEGYNCSKKEVSGDRLWSLLKELSKEPHILFQHVFVHNYCPLVFLAESGKNITPPELKVRERQALEEICDISLIQVIQLLDIKHLVCIGNYVLRRAKAVKVAANPLLNNVEISSLMHPSPANPSANKGWREIAMKQLEEANVLPYFNCSKKEKTPAEKIDCDKEFMEAAFEQAEEALAKGEVPVGCVFVYRGDIIARGRNTVNETKNATRHAEMNALDSVFAHSKTLGLPYESILRGSSLYVTVEPCIMCADALRTMKLGRLVFGCSNDKFGGCGSVIDLTNSFENLSLVKGFEADRAVYLMREFYKGENPNAPSGKAKRKTNSKKSDVSPPMAP